MYRIQWVLGKRRYPQLISSQGSGERNEKERGGGRGVVIPATVIVCASGTVERATVGGGNECVVYYDGRSNCKVKFPCRCCCSDHPDEVQMIAACVRPGDKSKFRSPPKTPLKCRKVASFVVYGITPLGPFFCPVCVLVYIPPGKLSGPGALRFSFLR